MRNLLVCIDFTVQQFRVLVRIPHRKLVQRAAAKANDMIMSLPKFFNPTNALPTAKDTGLSEHVIREANKALENSQKGQQVSEDPPVKKTRKYTTTFSPEDRAEIGKHAAENRNAAAVRKYGVGESTARLFTDTGERCFLQTSMLDTCLIKTSMLVL